MHPVSFLLLAGLLAAVPGGAQTPSAPGDGPATPSGSPWTLDLGWNEGPTYEIGGPYVAARGRIGGSLYLDGGLRLGDDPIDRGLAAEIRRARLYTRGQLVTWAGPEYKFEFAIEEDEFFLNDFYLRWWPRRGWVDRLQWGYFDPPLSLSALGSSSARSLMEVAAPVAAFAPGYRLGVGVGGRRPDPDLTWALNASSVGQQAETGDASRERLRLTGRLVWRPWHAEAADAPTLLHLGASVSWVDAAGGELRYRARPGSFLSPYLVDTGDLEGEATLVALEAAWRRGPASVQTELFGLAVDADARGRLAFSGATLLVSRVLTGEFRPYDPATALFGRVVPAEDLAPFRGRWGALELAGRLSWVDLSDGDVQGGAMLSAQVGVAWTWNRFVRIQAGYVFAHTSERPDTTTAHILQTRLELVF